MYQYHIAPMMGWTDRHFRYFMRLLGGDAFLMFSEMVTSNAIVFGDAHQYLEMAPDEGVCILQLGGSDIPSIQKAIQIAEKYPYSGYNLNVGCPSDRVQNAKIGACLMAEGVLVRDVLKAMMDSTDKPVSIKTRVGIDGVDSYEYFKQFVDEVLPSGCQSWIVHARDAWLKGLSPKQNRSIPPLRYEYVYQLKKDYPHLDIAINGGFVDKESIKEALLHVDAVMLGRAAYQNPRLIHALGNSQLSYIEALKAYANYMRATDVRSILRLAQPLVVSLTGYHGAKQDRAKLAQARTKDAMLKALDEIELLK